MRTPFRVAKLKPTSRHTVFVEDADGIPVGSISIDKMHVEHKDLIVDRLLTSLNACEGVHIDKLKTWITPVGDQVGLPEGSWMDHLIFLRQCGIEIQKQRDELVALLKASRDVTWTDEAEHLAAIDRAIAESEPDQPVDVDADLVAVVAAEGDANGGATQTH
jgi:hypothetical protein